MPELPEVETYVRSLRAGLLGRTITGLTVKWPRSIKTPLKKIRGSLPGSKIIGIERRGKYILIQLDPASWLVIHLKMSGRLAIHPRSEPADRHAHTIFHLDGDEDFRFRDIRKFGRVYFVENHESVTGSLGPEPLSEEFTPACFLSMLRRRKGRLKPLLLKQEFIAGIGNIYSDEICFEAKLDPRRKVEGLSDREISRLHQAIRGVLDRGIASQGASLDEVYAGGSFQNEVAVYRRTGEPCAACGALIERIICAGRSTHFCPRCQR
jgi:formamidopyrimidine-DNA glycosylase